MNRKNNTMPETAVDMKPERAEVYARFESGNRRLMRAIDFLLDYILELEMVGQMDIEEPECQVEEPENMQDKVEADELPV